MSESIYQAGIYNIINTVSGKHYIGSATNLRKRWTLHCRRLRNNAHENRHLQAAWNKYGAEAFTFDVIEIVTDHASLTAIEQLYINSYWDSGRLYNIARIAGSRLGVKASDETRERLRNSHIGKVLPDEQKRKIGEACRGRVLSEETKRRMSDASTGKPKSQAHKDSMRAARTGKPGARWTDASKHKASIAATGRPKSEEHKRKLALAQTGKRAADEAKRKMSLFQKGKTFSDEYRRKLSEAAKKWRAAKANLGAELNTLVDQTGIGVAQEAPHFLLT